MFVAFVIFQYSEIYLYVSISVLLAFISVHCVHVVPEKTRRGHHKTQKGRELLVCVLRIKLESTGRAASALHC